jgi:hypothetical protein
MEHAPDSAQVSSERFYDKLPADYLNLIAASVSRRNFE